jgi:ketosteroid isomerase-like protein
MASANLDLVRSIYSEWERGDFRSTAWAHPRIEYAHADGPDPGTWSGLAGMAKGLRDFLSVWDEWSISAEEFRELDDERVLVLISYAGRGKTSGVEVGAIRATGAALFHIRAGSVRRLVMYLDRESALADLGLAPDAPSAGCAAPES